jgi:hypothetical protein
MMARKRGPHTRAFYIFFVSMVFAAQWWTFGRELLAHTAGAWAPPLDDAFIHAQFARNAATGHPLQWMAGEGVSSGGTSILWPFLLAIPWALGARGTFIVPASHALAVTLLVVAFAVLEKPLRKVHPWAPWTALALVAVDGPVAWHTYSGMEFALTFAALAGLLRAASDHRAAPSSHSARTLAAAGIIAVLSRPEALVAVLVVAVVCGAAAGRARGEHHGVRTLIAAAGPALVMVAATACLYRAATGFFSASGAIAKLVTTHPLFDTHDVVDKLASNAVYAMRRILSRDASVDPAGPPLDRFLSLGALAFATALAPLAIRKRLPALALFLFVLAWVPVELFPNDRVQALFGYAFVAALLAALALSNLAEAEEFLAILLVLAAAWTLVAATNGQVIYHQDRYLIPARALWLVAAGAAAPLAWSRLREAPLLLAPWYALALAALVSNAGAGERWRVHYAKACANIHEQHAGTAKFLKTLDPKPTRVLLNDAGAIPYLSDLPALDFVGLGGFRQLPFARAYRLGVGASLELLEHVPAEARPSHLAIYPAWFPALADSFGRELRRFPVHDNVVCAGPENIVYAADWSPLGAGEDSASLFPGFRAQTVVDIGDVFSEDAHDVRTSRPLRRTFAVRPIAEVKRVFDGGAALQGGDRITFRVEAPSGSRIVLRVGPITAGAMRIAFDDVEADGRSFQATSQWIELAFPVPPAGARTIAIAVSSGELLVAHAWVIVSEATK